jgi:hypothetical protein
MMYAVAVLAGMLGAFIVVALMRVNGDQDLFDEGYLQGLRDQAAEYEDRQLKFDFDQEGAK